MHHGIIEITDEGVIDSFMGEMLMILIIAMEDSECIWDVTITIDDPFEIVGCRIDEFLSWLPHLHLSLLLSIESLAEIEYQLGSWVLGIQGNIAMILKDDEVGIAVPFITILMTIEDDVHAIFFCELLDLLYRGALLDSVLISDLLTLALDVAPYR